MAGSAQEAHKKLAVNRRALHDYHVLERLEAGIELVGTEVKSIKAGHITLQGSFGRVDHKQVILHNLNVPTYEFGNQFNHQPDRPRRLLLHSREILRLHAQTQQKGMALIPISAYLKRGLIKIELGVCRGKQDPDKRESIRRRTAEREAQRAIAARR